MKRYHYEPSDSHKPAFLNYIKRYQMIMEFLNQQFNRQSFSNLVFKQALDELKNRDEALEAMYGVIGEINEKYIGITDDDFLKKQVKQLTRKFIAKILRRRRLLIHAKE